VSSDGQKAAERALDLLVYAPVGVALYLRDTVPTFVNLFVSRGKAEVGQRKHQARGQVSQAKAMGEFAVGFGGPKLREQVEKGIAVARKGAESVLAGMVESDGPQAQPSPSPAPPTPAPQRREAAGSSMEPERNEARGSATSAAAPTATTLGIPDYDELSASQVVERLDGLHRGELDAVRAYEEAHRGRRTILFKIEQLTG
jgi:hypothetical protein